MPGPMRRPTLSSLSLDFRSVAALAKAGARVFGDDGLLSVIVEEIERDGFRVVGVEELLGGFLAPAGHLAGHAIGPADEADIARWIAVLRTLGAADVGQAAAVQEGQVQAAAAGEGPEPLTGRAGGVRAAGGGD